MFDSSHNPYGSPASDVSARHRTVFSPDNLPFVLVPPRSYILVAAFFALLFAVISVGILAGVSLQRWQPATGIVIALIFGTCSFVATTAPFTSLTIDKSGLSMRGLRNVAYRWEDIKSWRLDDKSGLLLIVDHSGTESMIANLAVTPTCIPEIVKALIHFRGTRPQSETINVALADEQEVSTTHGVRKSGDSDVRTNETH